MAQFCICASQSLHSLCVPLLATCLLSRRASRALRCCLSLRHAFCASPSRTRSHASLSSCVSSPIGCFAAQLHGQCADHSAGAAALCHAQHARPLWKLLPQGLSALSISLPGVTQALGCAGQHTTEPPCSGSFAHCAGPRCCCCCRLTGVLWQARSQACRRREAPREVRVTLLSAPFFALSRGVLAKFCVFFNFGCRQPVQCVWKQCDVRFRCL